MSSYFNDGVRRVDFVLTFTENNSDKQRKLREIFEKRLLEYGLHLEYDDRGKGVGRIVFVKVHAPWRLLARHAEFLKFKMPIRKDIIQRELAREGGKLRVSPFEERSLWDMFHPAGMSRERKNWLQYEFSRDKLYLFDVPPNDRERFFTSAQRSKIVEFILKHGSVWWTKQGITELISEGAYDAAYPLHEREGPFSLRTRLRRSWASLSRAFNTQPLDEIRDYFGIKIALYFVWLGFYNIMLIPASIGGVLCFIYSIMALKDDIPTRETCSSEEEINMCPNCDIRCTSWKISDMCVHKLVRHLFDNSSVVSYTVFMSIWTAIYLGLWKRYLAMTNFHWDLADLDLTEENVRPEYLATLKMYKHLRTNLLTGRKEPYLPFWTTRFPFQAFSTLMVILLAILALSGFVGIIRYRVALSTDAALKQDAGLSPVIIIIISGALLNLAWILLMNKVFDYVAIYLTDWEKPRTKTNYDNSLTLKMYLFRFISYFSSFFYIAFFKGRFIGHPGEIEGPLIEKCVIGGCFMELSITVVIIQIGNQVFNTIMETTWPYLWGLYRKWKIKPAIYRGSKLSKKTVQPQWERDYYLLACTSVELFDEYLEMVVQFGLITIFVAAFPLAPFFALLNNLFEVRLDALKLLNSMRRPVPMRVSNIGIWYRIMDAEGKLAVLTNALLIAFTSDFVPRQYYMHFVSPTGTLKGYVNFTLSYFNFSDFARMSMISDARSQPAVCRYRDFREPHWKPNKYEYTMDFWRIMTLRLAFVVVFVNAVYGLKILLDWLIPVSPSMTSSLQRQRMALVSRTVKHQEDLIKRKKSWWVPLPIKSSVSSWP